MPARVGSHGIYTFRFEAAPSEVRIDIVNLTNVGSIVRKNVGNPAAFANGVSGFGRLGIGVSSLEHLRKWAYASCVQDGSSHACETVLQRYSWSL
jgi:hypothetical protein